MRTASCDTPGRSHEPVIERLFILAASMSLAGCAVSDPTQYYTLGQATVKNAESRSNASCSVGGVRIGVGPVSIPDYLDRSQIVTGVGTDRVEFLMSHRWAEPLENAITRILTEEISARVPTERIVTYPWRDMVARAMRCQVVVAVVRFDGRPGGDVTLDTRWRILGRDGDELAFERLTVIQAAMGPSLEDLVAGMGRALSTLGREIAVEVRPVSSPIL